MTVRTEVSGPTLPPATEQLPLAAMLRRNAERWRDKVALRHKDLGRWCEYTWAEYADRTAAAGLGLLALGVQPGDKVAVIGENRPEWLWADLGAQGIGAVTVGVYSTSPAAEVEYILDHSGSVVAVVEDEEQLDKVLQVRERLPLLRHIVLIEPRGARHHLEAGLCITFDALLESPAVIPANAGAQVPPAMDAGFRRHDGHGVAVTPAKAGAHSPAVTPAKAGVHVDQFWSRVDALRMNDVAIIVYTSGTTGPPKGAMLSHANLASLSRSWLEVWAATPEDELLSYLPLCHVLERALSTVVALRAGYRVSFGGGGEALISDLREVQPTLFVGVPRVWEKMLASVEIKMADASWLKRKIYKIWIARGRALARKKLTGEPWSLLDRIDYALGWLLLYRPLRDRLGIARVRAAGSGAAPIAPQVLEFFWALGLPIQEGYGQTEGSALATFNPPGAARIGTVGLPVAGATVRIAEDGEILVKGPGVFAGYYRNEQATRDTVDEDGWLHSGDVGVLDAEGYLTITDRKKDLIITAGGKNIAPSWIENMLKVSPYVREAIVIGDRRKYVSALIGIELDTVGDWATRQRIPFTTYKDLSERPEVRKLIQGWVDSVNNDLAQVEQVKKFALLPKELDHEEGELTATQKVKRRAIASRFEDLVEGLYR